MAKFQGVSLGDLLTLLGWDGTDFRNVKVDSDGHLQVDVLGVADLSGALESVDTDGLVAYIAKFSGSWTALSLDSGSRLMVTVDVAALPADAATETSLQGVEDRIGALAAPASGSVNWRLDKILTQVTTPSLPSDAATETSLQGIEDQVKDTLYNIKDGLYDRITVTGSAGNNWVTSTAVPAGEIWHITLITCVDVTTGLTSVWIGTHVSGVTMYFKVYGAVALNIAVAWDGNIWLKEGEQIRTLFGGVTNNDTLYMTVYGHKMSI